MTCGFLTSLSEICGGSCSVDGIRTTLPFLGTYDASMQSPLNPNMVDCTSHLAADLKESGIWRLLKYCGYGSQFPIVSQFLCKFDCRVISVHGDIPFTPSYVLSQVTNILSCTVCIGSFARNCARYTAHVVSFLTHSVCIVSHHSKQQAIFSRFLWHVYPELAHSWKFPECLVNCCLIW